MAVTEVVRELADWIDTYPLAEHIIEELDTHQDLCRLAGE